MLKKIKPHENLSLQDIECEEWRDIEGFEGYYMVSDMGRIKSLYRKYLCLGGYYKEKRELILKQKQNHRRSNTLTVNFNIKQLDISCGKIVSILVAKAFLKQKTTTNKIYVSHADNNPLNNRVANLAYKSSDTISDKICLSNYYLVNKKTKYKGVCKKNDGFGMKISVKNEYIEEFFKDELEAARKYDYYIKKFNLKRKGNFI